MFSAESQSVSKISIPEEQICFPIKTHSKSPAFQKQQLIEKIRFYQKQKDELEYKHQTLQNTLVDLRKLVQIVNNENEEYMEKVEGENEKLMDKKDRFSSALKYVHRDGNHFERCALYWRQFV